MFLMDRMWSRFFPATLRLRKWLSQGPIGQIMGVEADVQIECQTVTAGLDHTTGFDNYEIFKVVSLQKRHHFFIPDNVCKL